MQTTFTKEFMQANCGCYTLEQLSACSFMKSDSVTLGAILDSEIKLKDKFWFVCKKLATKEQNQQIAIGVAEIVLVVFEDKYPDDKRPREAIQAARGYLSGVIGLDELRIKRAAAYAAANAAANAANASYAAAFTAYAAAFTAYAADASYASCADYAAYAANAANAANAADAADAADALNTSLLTFLKEICHEANQPV